MIDAPVLLKSLQRLEKELEEDLRTRVSPGAAASPLEQEVATELDAKLRAEYREAKEGGRTGQAFEVWRDEYLTQVAVAWILGCVFVRFMEDNGLVETPRLSGPGERRQRALDEHELYFKNSERRTHSDREYLLDVFEQTQNLPAARELFDAKHNPLWAMSLSGDGATKLLRFWQHLDPETGALDHDFTDPNWNTRFLGDIYQDLSESARQKYDLLQTPEFVEEFILDRTLTPAIEEFGFQEVRLIDPTCGSGHFLLGAFHRLFDLWVKHQPGTNPRELAQRALDQVYGVDLNPFAVAIARFRLLVEALMACDVKRLADAPAFHLNLAAGDSLLHGRRLGAITGVQQMLSAEDDPIRHVYEVEDAESLARILGQQYSAVVGNPPYSIVGDKALSAAYRQRYASCYRKYSLVVPFVERFFDLAFSTQDQTGYVGLLAGSSFMKREFGKRLIEGALPHLELSYVIDMSGVHIPGPGIPTVILLARNRAPLTNVVRTITCTHGGAGEGAEQGEAWAAILAAVDSVCLEDQSVTSADVPRSSFSRHPWSLTGGSEAEIMAMFESVCKSRIGDYAESIGFGVILGEDDAFSCPHGSPRALSIPEELQRDLVDGELVRNWTICSNTVALFPYSEAIEILPDARCARFLWPARRLLELRADFSGRTFREAGRKYWEYHQIPIERNRGKWTIAFAEMATHNHFAMNHGHSVFNRSAPIISLPEACGEDERLGLLGFLNSSLSCFWLRQVSHSYGAGGGTRITSGKAALGDESWENHFAFTSTRVSQLPVPDFLESSLPRAIDLASQEFSNTMPSSVVRREAPTKQVIDRSIDSAACNYGRMVTLQEELDWYYYVQFGICESSLGPGSTDVPEIAPGERAFEIILASDGQGAKTTWFSRHDLHPQPSLSEQLPESYRTLVSARIEAINTSKLLGTLERPEYKRRWFGHPWETGTPKALRHWLARRLEAAWDWGKYCLVTTSRLADAARQDPTLMEVAENFAGRPDFDPARLIEELIEEQCVPLLPVLRFKPSGQRKRAGWGLTWELQRREDLIAARAELDSKNSRHLSETETSTMKSVEVGDIPEPPKYVAGDYRKSEYWRLRGKLDVPKERFVSFPHCERNADPSLVIGWAGWDHLELARATATYYIEMKEQEGWPAERLTPLLTALLELLPWVKQWHNDPDAEHGVRMGDYFEDFVNEEVRALGLSLEQIKSWKPPKKSRARRPRKKATRNKKVDPEAKSA